MEHTGRIEAARQETPQGGVSDFAVDYAKQHTMVSGHVNLAVWLKKLEAAGEARLPPEEWALWKECIPALDQTMHGTAVILAQPRPNEEVSKNVWQDLLGYVTAANEMARAINLAGGDEPLPEYESLPVARQLHKELKQGGVMYRKVQASDQQGADPRDHKQFSFFAKARHAISGKSNRG